MEKLPYYNESLSREMSVNSSNADREEVLSVLLSPFVLELADTGQLSVAMVRPNVGPDANIMSLEDIQAASEIENQIENLGVVAKVSFRFTDEIIEEFYEGPSKDNMKNNPARQSDVFDSTWSEFKALMTSGPSTLLLLHHPSDAITEWRNHLGHWNIEKTRDPSTIRGRLGVNNYNNLVHGSDSPTAVKRELRLIAQAIELAE